MAHIPGYNYCGPGTYDYSKKPKNQLDRLCRKHDLDYKKYGASAYTTWNKADSDFLGRVKNVKGPWARVVEGVFRAKKLTQMDYSNQAGTKRTIPDYWKQVKPGPRFKKQKMYKRKYVKRFKGRGRKYGYRKRRFGRRVRSRSRRRYRRAGLGGYRRLRKTVNSLRKKDFAEKTKNFNRVFDSGTISVGINDVNYHNFSNAFALTTLRNHLNALQVADTVTLGTTGISTIDAYDVSGDVKVRYKYAKETVRIKNNNLVNAVLDIYWCMPKRNTNNTPGTCVAAGFPDRGLTNTSDNRLVWLPHDSQDFMKTYRVYKHKVKTLKPGDHWTVQHSMGRRYISDDFLSNITGEYISGISTQLFVRIRGDVCHDTTTDTLVGYDAAQVDYVVTQSYTLLFSDAIRTKFNAFTINTDAITTGEQALHDVEMETKE